MVIDPNSVVLKQSKNASRINKDALLATSVQKNSAKIIAFNKTQMRSGYDSTGNYFTPYSVDYLARKQKLASYKAPSGIPDLYLSGDFQNSMDLTVESNDYYITSDAPHANYVLNRYPNAFYLNNTYLTPMINIITPEFNKAYHEALNK